MDWTKIKVISWDFDGTLYSLSEMKKKFSWIVLIELLKLNVRALSDFYKLWKFHRKVKTYRNGDKLGIAKTELQEFEQISTYWYGKAIQKTGAYNEILEVVKYLSDKTHVIYSDYNVNEKIGVLFSNPFWSKCYAGSEYGFLKPSNYVLKKIMQDFEISPHELLHIGDKECFDGVAAKNVGCNVLVLGKDFHNYKELLNKLEKQCI